jgi:uncharacterized repeat protein (TIGR01451 family)
MAGSQTVTLDPDRIFHAGEVLRVSATRGISSTGGAALTPYGWQFTAGPILDRCVGAFTDIGATLSELSMPAAAWGDYDSDGDLDILLTGYIGGSGITKLYRNDGPSGFAAIATSLTGVYDGSVAWGDYDNDGDLDILLTGDRGSGYVSKVYRNDGSGTFSDIGAGLPGLGSSSVAWGDYDNDGDLDILLTGSGFSEVYRNDEASGFTAIGAGLTGVAYSSVAWGDYDNDGDLDILLTGHHSDSRVSQVYRNDTPSGFVDIGAGLTGVESGSVAWGDYDNDGDLDILLTGRRPIGPVASVYRNDTPSGSGFTDIGAGLEPVRYSSAAWGDMDNDGDLDILLTGEAGSRRVSIVYRNDGSSGFTNIRAGLTGVYSGSVAWGDYDNDGDLDILLTGKYIGVSAVSKVYRNEDCAHIIAHDPASHELGVELAAVISATFDADMNASTVTNDTFVVHGHLGGVAAGSIGYDNGSRTVTLDPDREFHAGEVLRVSATSAIENASGLPLAAYGWQFTAGPILDRCAGGFSDLGAALTGVSESSAAWGDYDSDGDLDILLTGKDSSANPVSKLYRHDGDTAAPAFTDTGVTVTQVYNGSVAWGDYDNDGDLDILLTGDAGAGRVSQVYRNDGGAASPAFSDIAAGLTGVAGSSAAWGDYDNDGDLDILLTGSTGSARRSKVYRNDGSSGFTDIAAALTPVGRGSVAWGDYDNDGDLDILLTGNADTGRVSQVYRNDGPSGFTNVGAGLTGVRYSSVAWGDYDRDSDLDILLTGYTGTSRLSRVYRNDGASGFTDIGAGLTDVMRGSAAWGDYDNDGDLDILLTGEAGSGRVSKVYRNDGAGAFSDTGAGLTGVRDSSAAWGDVDNDGSLDILLTGVDNTGIRVSKVYRNEECPDLSIAKQADLSTAQPGQRITYTIVISNSGGSATGAVVSDTLPGDLSLAGPVTLDPPDAGTVGAPPALVYDATIAADGAITVTFPVTVNTGLAVGTVITNTAAVTSSGVTTPEEASVAITVANARPKLGTVDPAGGSGPTEVTTYFTTTWKDTNGWEDLKQCYFHIGDSPSIVGNVTLLYNAAKEKLWLRSDDGTAWTGGFAPGTANLLENSQALVHCDPTTVLGAGDTLSVTWAIEFKPGYTGAKKTGLKCKDRSKAKAKGKWKGTWTVEGDG